MIQHDARPPGLPYRANPGGLAFLSKGVSRPPTATDRP